MERTACVNVQKPTAPPPEAFGLYLYLPLILPADHRRLVFDWRLLSPLQRTEDIGVSDC